MVGRLDIPVICAWIALALVVAWALANDLASHHALGKRRAALATPPIAASIMTVVLLGVLHGHPTAQLGGWPGRAWFILWVPLLLSCAISCLTSIVFLIAGLSRASQDAKNMNWKYALIAVMGLVSTMAVFYNFPSA